MEIKQKIDYIKDRSREYSTLFEDEKMLYERINSTSIDYAKELIDWYKPNVGLIKPVNFFRYILANEVARGNTISPELFSDIKEKLETRNLNDFAFLSPEIKDAFQKYPIKSKSFFAQWKKPVRVLFPFFYTESIANNVYQFCKDIGNEVITDLNLKNVSIHPVDFQGSQNYGQEHVWIAIYPSELKDHKYAYQLFIRIEGNNIIGGLLSGSGISEEISINERKNFESFPQLILFLKEIKTQWQELNNDLLQSQTFTSIDNNYSMNNPISLNQILFGPPGTGKTYNTISEAIKIIDPDFYERNFSNREKLQNRFNELLIKDWKNTNGQIAFCTFHQSFSYEDFVEGIKPKATDDKQVYYEIEDGIFKSICRHADATNNVQILVQGNLVSFTEKEFNNAVFYKVSLGDSTKAYGKEVYEYCISNNVISIGFGEDIDFTGKDEEEVNELVKENSLEPYSAQAINYFKNYLQVGNYVVISNGNLYIRALGKVTGEYKFEEQSEIGFNHFRSVEWIFKDVEIPVNEFYEKNLSQQTIYRLKKEFIIPSFFVKEEKKAVERSEPKNFVIIIDEINRGNVSSIFGELITLIEPTKRAGNSEALEAVLPYSKKRFSVPANVFIIGTMNTADRSIESLDTALRRRFSFKEMPPKPSLIESEGKSRGLVDDIDLVQLLERINYRIEKLIDKDHKIGHSYFIDVVSKRDLQMAFKDKVIPLLEEYFFGDFGKIGLVLGSSFVSKNTEDFEFAKFEEYDSLTEQDLKQRAIYSIKPIEDWDFKKI